MFREIAAKLKPCPFCGGEASIHCEPITHGYEYHVECDRCKVRGGIIASAGYDDISTDTAKTFVSMVWNHRTTICERGNNNA